MSRFVLSNWARIDLDQLESDLDACSFAQATRIAVDVEEKLHSIGRQPFMGAPHSGLTRILGTEVRSRLSGPYRIYYRFDGRVPETVAILHTARDAGSLFADRFQ